MSPDPGRWFLRRAPRVDPALRLFCLPFAGGGASAYHPWFEAFGPQVEVIALQLPGREVRLRETPYRSVSEASRAIADALTGELDRRYAMFGYSLGALLAFEVTRELRRRGTRTPERLVLASRHAPTSPDLYPPMAELPRERLVAAVRHHFRPPEAAWAVPELVDLVLPALRADLAMSSDYRYREEAPLDLPIDCILGDADRSCPRASAEAWRDQTTGAFRLDLVPGGHFFMHESPRQLLDVVRCALSAGPEPDRLA